MEAGDINNFKATELRLGLPGSDETTQKPAAAATQRGSKRGLEEASEEGKPERSCTKESEQATAPAAKAQVVGWPPVRSYRKNCFQARKAEVEAAIGQFVKVGMDGAPYLRKIDLKVYKGYKDLREALEGMFKCFSIGFSGREGYSGSDFAITYEDKDGDWMLAGDVPWEMFTSSCKRLRIMKSSEARGLGSS